jgi:hypothetical protein
MGLWVLAGSWCTHQLTDGHVPLFAVRMLGSVELAAALVAAGLWEVDEEGWRFHEWDLRQRTRAQIEAERKVDRERKRRSKALRSDSARNPTGVTVESAGSHAGFPVGKELRSSPTKKTRPTKSSDERPEVDRLCEHLRDRIVANGSRPPAVTKAWRDAARLMLDRDELAEEKIHKAIDFSQDSAFWRSVILSMPKLREKYDQLRLDATRGQNGAGSRDELPEYLR